MTVRKDTAGPGMKSLTCCRETRPEWSEESERSEFRRNTAWPGMKSLTFCQARKTKVGWRIVRRNTAESSMESLTGCQANRIRVSKWGQWEGTSDIKSLTACQANRARVVGVKTVRRGRLLNQAWNHSLPVKPIGSKDSKHSKGHSCQTWHGINSLT